MEEDLNVAKKAELFLGGTVRLPNGFEVPTRVSMSTAGPGAGSASVVFRFGRFRVKKAISWDEGEFQLIESDGRLSILKEGMPFIDEVTIEPVVHHCPDQAFFNLDSRCIFNCAYCTSPRLKVTKSLTNEDIIRMVDESIDRIEAISLTSGVFDSVDMTVDRMVDCVRRLRERYVDIPIGVEPYVSDRAHIEMFMDAGATEIKLNLETPSRQIFEKVCPDLSYDGIGILLREAVSIFGRGNVSSNIIYGMGETDDELMHSMDMLAEMGVIPVLRALKCNKINRDALFVAIGDQPRITVERSMRLSLMLKDALMRHGLRPEDCKTMCIRCTCCDIIPFVDI